MKRKLLRVLSYLAVAAVSVAVTLGVCAQGQGTSKLDALETLIEEKFIGEADATAMEDAAADAMVSATGDRWSYYISAADYSSYLEQSNNAYVGIGVTVTADEDTEGFAIMEVTSGSGAEEAGMAVGDIIVGADGQDVRGMALSDMSALVKGEEGTSVTITYLRDGQEAEVSVERRTVETAVATGQMLTDTVGYIAIENFDSRCASETIAQIESLLDQGAEKLIFDVRYNPGGYASELVEVLDYLLPEGEIFRTVRYNGQEEVDTSDASCLDIPMAVLVNASSYSAAEFFAAALQEYEAAVIVGEKTVGKGYFQNTFLFDDGSAVALSVGKYYTPKGNNLAGVGITPDVECPVEDEEIAAGIRYGTLALEEDPQVLAALAALE